MMNNKMYRSKTSAGTGAPVLTVIALAWNAVVWGLLMPEPGLGIAAWFKAASVLVGAVVAVGAVQRWVVRLQGTGVTLNLTHEPVPQGVPTTAVFTLGRPLKVQAWTLLVAIDSPDDDLSGFGRIWERRFAVTTVPMLVAGEIMVQSVRADFTLPADLPSTRDDFWRVSLVLDGDGMKWPFDIATRPETTSERGFHRGGAAFGSLQPAVDEPPLSDLPEPDAELPVPSLMRLLGGLKWARRGALALSLGVVGWVAWNFALPTWSSDVHLDVAGESVEGEGRALDVGESDESSRLSTRVSTPEFDVLLSNWLIDDWRLRAHMQGVAQVEQGKLRVRIQQLALMPVGPCQHTGECQVQSIRLLLSQAGADGPYITLAQSKPLPWVVDLAQDHVAHRIDGEFVLTLPESLTGDHDVRLQLMVQTASPDAPANQTKLDNPTYPSHGNHMGLQLALTVANPSSSAMMDPCDRVRSLIDAVRAHCEGQIDFRLASNAHSGRTELDEALIEAIKHYNGAAVPSLLKAGASPNAIDSRQKSVTALGLAAAGDQLDVLNALIKAGAQVNHHAVNADQQTTTPLSLALKLDAVHAVDRLLAAGAKLHDKDLSGWSVMHIAALEGATNSLKVLVWAGGNVNEQAKGHHRQTALHAALQFAPQATIEAMLVAGADTRITDDEGKDACDWANASQRSAAIQALVCSGVRPSPVRAVGQVLTTQ
jgi:ankyrin repeat protein